MKNMIYYCAKGKEENTDAKNDHAKKIAGAIAVGAKTPSYAIGAHSVVSDTGVLFVGCESKNGKIPRIVRNFLKTLSPKQVKLVVVFSVITGGTDSALAAVKTILDPAGVSVSGEEFICKGASAFSNKGCPTEQDFENAKAFAAQVVSVNKF